MAFVLADRVKETTTVTGTTSPISLLGAVTGYQSFAAIGNANVTYYTIAGQTGSEWEVGIGTYTASGTTLSRDTVLSSSNGGALVNFSAGTKDVWCDYPAGRAVQGGDGYIENDATISVSSTINTGNNAISGGPLTINSGITVTVPSGSVWTVV
jgi:hypothetical protein